MKDSILATPSVDDAINDLDQQIQEVFNCAVKKYGSCALIIKWLEPIGAVSILNMCSCCYRHRVDKPHKFELVSDFNFGIRCKQKNTLEQMEQLNECMCDCRHLVRWLCRGTSVETLCMNCD